MVLMTTPSMTHRIVRLVLSTHITRPVRHRASRAPGMLPRLWSSARVGVAVILTRRCIVRRSTSPVTAKPRFSWNPRTASTVSSP